MFKAERSNSTLGSSFALFELIFHSTVRSIRKSHGNAIIGLLMNILQTVILIATFYIMSHVLGMRGSAVGVASPPSSRASAKANSGRMP